MNIEKIIEILKTFPKDSLVSLTYDSIVLPIEVDDIYISADGVVMIGSGYKEDFVSGRLKVKDFIDRNY